jgi:thiosulfate dehydrogenase [quinone] large subunit
MTTHITTAARRSPVARLRGIVLAPFTHVYAAPLWLAIRLYLGYMWLMMGIGKIGAGFLTGDPIGPILQLNANGTLPVPVELWRPVAGLLVNLGVTPLISMSMPFLEIAVALAFVSGVLVAPAAIGASLLNVIFILAGIGQIQLDGRFIALQLLLVLAFRVAGTIGVEKLAFRIVRAAYRKVRPAPAAKAG